MFGTRWQIFRLLGIPVFVDASWLIILALLTLSLGSSFPFWLQTYFPDQEADLGAASIWALGLLTALAFFGCILLHEFGHAVVARWQRLPVRGITLFLFGGVADIGEEPRSAKGELLMALAGPLVSLILALAAGIASWVGFHAGWLPALVVGLGFLAAINVVVLIFNMIPAFPLDGGRVLRALIWGATGNLRRATFWASLVGTTFAWFLMAWGIFQFFLGNWLGGIWMGLIGLFLKNAAASGYQQVLVRQALEGEPVGRFMNADPITVSPSLDLRTWVDEFVYRYHRKTFPVVVEDRLVGCINTQALTQIPRQEWGLRTVEEVMQKDLGPITITPWADALQALRQIQRTGSSRLLVAEGGHLVGIVSIKDLLGFLSLKMELEGDSANDPDPSLPETMDTPAEVEELAGKR